MTFRWRARTALGALLVLWTAVAASAAPYRQQRTARPERLISSVTIRHDGPGSLIAVTYRGHAHRTRFLYAQEPIDRVAVRDVDNDGDPDILAAPQQGGLLLWRNRGHGRFALATAPPGDSPLQPRGPRLEQANDTGDGVQLGDERTDAALLHAPSVPDLLPVAPALVPSVVSTPSASLRSASTRGPPSFA